jgi:asparagine synthase (glutamine-hydrolysing)
LGEHATAAMADKAIDMHPWFRNHERAPRGIAMIALGLCMPFEFYHPLGKLDDADPEWLYPLFSQQLVELCLRIPSYIHAYNGRDRELVRDAFRGDVPLDILRRHWKDRGEGQSETALSVNIAFAREMLLDGILTSSGYLDRRRTELVLKGTPTKQATYPNEVIDYLLIETWLRNTTSAQQRIAA